jgi:hypothetical protein
MLKITITVYTDELMRWAIIAALASSFAMSCVILAAH